MIEFNLRTLIMIILIILGTSLTILILYSLFTGNISKFLRDLCLITIGIFSKYICEVFISI